MIEMTNPLGHLQAARVASDSDQRGTLRTLERRELTARLNAARDFRQVLLSEAASCTRAASNSLADAAVRYFRAKDDEKPIVNPVALSESKGSPVIVDGIDGADQETARERGRVTHGDAREY